MKLSLILFLIIIGFNLNAQFVAINHRLADDGSSTLSSEDSASIGRFSIENFGKKLEFKTKSDVTFELINSNDFKQLVSKSKYTWLFIQSSWCGACIKGLWDNLKIVDSLKNEGISLIVINQDIQIKQLQKKIFNEKYRTLSYIIDPKYYGTIETLKQEKFVKEITNDIMISGYSPIGVPRNFFFDENGTMLYFDTTYKISVDLIREKVLKK